MQCTVCPLPAAGSSGSSTEQELRVCGIFQGLIQRPMQANAWVVLLALWLADHYDCTLAFGTDTGSACVSQTTQRTPSHLKRG